MRTEYPCKILVIEDDAGICRFLRATLTAAHYDVIVTDTGKKALEIVSSHCPDCILLDLGLPDLDGNDIIQSIRGRKRRLSSFPLAQPKKIRRARSTSARTTISPSLSAPSS